MKNWRELPSAIPQTFEGDLDRRTIIVQAREEGGWAWGLYGPRGRVLATGLAETLARARANAEREALEVTA